MSHRSVDAAESTSTMDGGHMSSNEIIWSKYSIRQNLREGKILKRVSTGAKSTFLIYYYYNEHAVDQYVWHRALLGLDNSRHLGVMSDLSYKAIKHCNNKNHSREYISKLQFIFETCGQL